VVPSGEPRLIPPVGGGGQGVGWGEEQGGLPLPQHRQLQYSGGTTLYLSSAATMEFGTAVAMSGDGIWQVLGAPGMVGANPYTVRRL
jgi:hypothetical protein